jgi:hypothetical protein
MMKQETIYTCDICGAFEKAQTFRTPYGDVEATMPKGWISSAINRDVHLCPKCVAVFEKRVAE